MSRKLAKRGHNLLLDYLKCRPNLRRVFVLIDSRHGPKQNDEEFMKFLDTAAVNFQIVLTKMDKTKGEQRETLVSMISKTLARHPAGYPEAIYSSSETGEGLDDLRTTIAAIS